MVTREFVQIDVFGTRALRGNPLAVVLDGDGLSGEAMQEFARWTNLSETTFLLPPSTSDADYRVRIFTTEEELPFAGHPTLGTAQAWLDAHPDHDSEYIIQECGVGLVTVRRTDTGLAFAAPPLLRSGPVDATVRAELAEDLQIDPAAIVDAAVIDNGAGWVGVWLAEAEQVLALQPTSARHRMGVAGPYPPGSEMAIEVRGFLPYATGGLWEDPVTGSLNAALGQWLLSSGLVGAPYLASQGQQVGARGKITISESDGQVWVAGATPTVIRGVVEI